MPALVAWRLGVFVFGGCFRAGKVETFRGLKHPEAIAAQHPRGQVAAFGHVFEEIVKSLVADAPDVRAPESPKVIKQVAGQVTAGEKDDVKMCPAVLVKLHFDAVGFIDAVGFAFPFYALAQLVENAAQAITARFKRQGRIGEQRGVEGEREKQTARHVRQSGFQFGEHFEDAHRVKP